MGGQWSCGVHHKDRQMICVTCNYSIICPDCQAKDHTKKRGHQVDNIQDFLDEFADAPEEKRNRLLAMKAAIEAQMTGVLKERQVIDNTVCHGQVDVAREAAIVLEGYKKTSDFARQKIVTSLTGLQTQRNLCDYYIDVISAMGDKTKLSEKFTPEQVAQMIQQWGDVEKNLSKPGEAVAESMAELIVKRNEFMQVHYEILSKLKSLETAWLQYALSDEKTLIEFARTLFLQVDTDRSGQLEYHELQNFIIAFFSSFASAPPPESEIHTLFLKYDTDQSGRLSFEESLNLAKDILNILLARAKQAAATTRPPA
jgi:hypothetical protein